MGFAVLHIEKGGAGNSSGLGNHIDRTKQVLNADPKKSDLNFFVRFDPAQEKVFLSQEWKSKLPLKERIQNRIQQGYTGKTAIRKDAVTHLNIVLTGSHEDMLRLEKDPKKFQDWVVTNYAFIGERFGWENIVDFTIHRDERTPHIHCVVVPLTQDGRLSAKEMMGDRRKMTQLQDMYGKAMENLYGLKRGYRGSTATHDSVREYYARIKARIIYPSSVSITPSFNTPKIPVPPLVGKEKWTERQNEAISDAFYALSKEYQAQAEKKAAKAIENAYTAKLQLDEKLDRLRKENAQLRGLVKEQDKQLHPEKYLHQEATRNLDRGMSI